MIDARVHLQSLVGQEIRTLSTNRVNGILRIEGEDVFVGTDKSPNGQPVSIRWLQDAVDVLANDQEIAVNVETFRHRSAFIGAFLATLPGAIVRRTNPRRVALPSLKAQ